MMNIPAIINIWMRRFVYNFDASIHHLKSSLIIVALSCSWFGRLVLISVDDETCCACFIDEKKNCTRNSCIPSFGHLLCRIPNWLGEIIDSCVCLTNYLVERTKYQGKKVQLHCVKVCAVQFLFLTRLLAEVISHLQYRHCRSEIVDWANDG